MSDLFAEFNQVGLRGIPLVAFFAGLGGSVHCIAMCGAFATSCSHGRGDLPFYNLGRLMSYTLMGLLSGLLGSSFTLLFKDPWVSSLPALLLGGFFLLWGVRSLKGRPMALKLPKKGELIARKLLGRTYSLPSGKGRSLLLGTFSVFLPCGLLYGVMLALMAFQNPLTGALGMFSFGLGTLPVMMLSPKVIMKVLRPLKERWPKLTSFGLISLGILTIIYRMVLAYEQVSCH